MIPYAHASRIETAEICTPIEISSPALITGTITAWSKNNFKPHATPQNPKDNTRTWSGLALICGANAVLSVHWRFQRASTKTPTDKPMCAANVARAGTKTHATYETMTRPASPKTRMSTR
eukprot:gnl/MRDRNA2_/MRDRNA2_55020_c0_seq1.p1 gnl/MRDRNA2_/MRDRNA2_55020_c0~~gnl/MRDRNA2_/MRDRNA2_55020_c0_seq1.p1  ORF type:complete len:120 (-),score=5.25 gnl/MRDRNA2_/MRDRNA2_55020_c0_seq1:110-469(-)